MHIFHWIRINKEGKAKVVSLLVGGRTWMSHLSFCCKDNIKKNIWESIHFGRVVVWWGVNRMIIHFFKSSIPPSSISSFSSNHPGATCIASVVRQGIVSPKQQGRPLPSLLYLSFFYAHISHLVDARPEGNLVWVGLQLEAGRVDVDGLVLVGQVLDTTDKWWPWRCCNNCDVEAV